jgi:hypothetical protein
MSARGGGRQQTLPYFVHVRFFLKMLIITLLYQQMSQKYAYTCMELIDIYSICMNLVVFSIIGTLMVLF